MTRNFLLLLALLSRTAWDQAAGGVDAFEVASIRPAPPPGAGGKRLPGCSGGPGSKDPAMIRCINVGLRGLIAEAYRVSDALVTGVQPPYPIFDVVAKVPTGATEEQVSRMWQNLLADRFKLAVHRETKELPAYLLVTAKRGLKAKESADQLTDPNDTNGPAFTPGGIKRDKDDFPLVLPGRSLVSYRNNASYLVASQCSMENLASLLERLLAVDTQAWRPVLDATHLSAKYDFRLRWEARGDGSGDAPSLIDALESQLGLRLEKRPAQIELLAVDHAESFPTEN
jgi:uncharacterized protein (TIGR03435 family)